MGVGIFGAARWTMMLGFTVSGLMSFAGFAAANTLADTGVVVLEAEQYQNIVQPGGEGWVKVQINGATAMQALPDAGGFWNDTRISGASRLDFDVSIPSSGNYYIWIRGLAKDGKSNSVHVGINGVTQTFSRRVNIHPSGEWEWTRETMDYPVVRVYFSSAGTHTINVWVREDGVALDKIVVAKNIDTVPYGLESNNIAPQPAPVASSPTPTVAVETGSVPTTTQAKGEIVYSNNLENAAVGPYTRAALLEDWLTWGSSSMEREGNVSIVNTSESNYSKALRIRFPGNERGQGAAWDTPIGHYDEIYLAYSVKFPAGFDFADGGKLPGLRGGVIRSNGNIPDGTDGWTARLVFNEGQVSHYVYHAGWRGPWGELLPWKADGKPVEFKPGEWNSVEMRIVMNNPGKSDGVIQTWLNGKLVLDAREFLFRKVDGLKIDKFFFSTFMGSASSSVSSVDQYVFLDNFVVSTGPITH